MPQHTQYEGHIDFFGQLVRPAQVNLFSQESFLVKLMYYHDKTSHK